MENYQEQMKGYKEICPKTNQIIGLVACEHCPHKTEVDYATEMVKCNYPLTADGWICPNCRVLNKTWAERCDCVVSTYEVKPDGSYEQIDSEYIGDSTLQCPECSEEVDDIHICDLLEHLRTIAKQEPVKV